MSIFNLTYPKTDPQDKPKGIIEVSLIDFIKKQGKK